MTHRLAVVATIALVLVSCSRKSSDNTKGRPSVPVSIGQASARDVPMEIQSIGTVQAYSMVSVRPQITGPIMEVHFQEGQEVKAGDLLFTIDPRSWEAALNQAQANLQRDEAQMISARLTFERTSNLFVSHIASQQDFDQAEAAYLGGVGTMAASAAAVTNAKVNLDYTAIRSPIDGRTGGLVVKKGNVVKAPDDVLVTIAQNHPVYVAFAVPEPQLPAIRRRSAETTLAVGAFAPSETNNIAWGELTFIDNTVDTNTGTISLRGTFANTNEMLWPGQFVRVSLILSNLVNATVVPSQAVQTSQNGEFVFVVKPDETVDMRQIVTGITYDGMRIIQSGVRPGETVVTDGQLRLTPGAQVNIKSSEPGGAPKGSTMSTQ
jgi:membrane fusion protein, multidrug efflux system